MSRKEQSIQLFLSVLKESKEANKQGKEFIWTAKYLTARDLYNYLFEDKKPKEEEKIKELEKILSIFAFFPETFNYSRVGELLSKIIFEDKIRNTESKLVLSYYLTNSQLDDINKLEEYENNI